MHGFGSLDLMLGAHDLVPAARHFGNRALQLGLELGNLQHRQGLPLMHAVADVDVNVADEPETLGWTSTT